MELEITELRLGLPGRDGCDSGLNSSSNNNKNEKKRAFSDICDEANYETNGERKINPTKSQVVGWPPVCSYRRKNSFNEKDGGESSKMYVKVSMDGAPFLRKIDLGMHQGYPDLAMSLEKLFGCFGLSEALKDADSSEFVPIYEDKDGDWMLAGDVPWERSPRQASSPEVPAYTDKSEYAGCFPGANPPTLKSDMKDLACYATVQGKAWLPWLCETLRVTPRFWGKCGCHGSVRSCVLRRGSGESVAVVPRFSCWRARLANCRRPGLLASRSLAGMALCLL
ncbi:auxin-responsive protein IAA19 [Citrus sinensis]|nr:auxin-responsive protein IAA19 [Citrus sinensis]